MPELIEEVKNSIEKIGKDHHQFKKTHEELESEVKKQGKASAEIREKLDRKLFRSTLILMVVTGSLLTCPVVP